MTYSKEEELEFFKYKKRIDLAVEEKDFFFNYIKNFKILDEQIKSEKPKAQRYIIDYIKILIKSKKKNSEIKFRALLLLKDLLTLENMKLVEYNKKKLLTRLFKIASKKEKHYLIFNKKFKIEKYGEKFCILVLECFKNWGKLFGRNFYDYSSYKNKLKKNLPENQTYFNIPNKKKEILRYFKAKIDSIFLLNRDLIKNIFIIEENSENNKVKNFIKIFYELKMKIVNLEKNIISEKFLGFESENFLEDLDIHFLIEFFKKFEINFDVNFNKEKKEIFFSNSRFMIREYFPVIFQEFSKIKKNDDNK